MSTARQSAKAILVATLAAVAGLTAGTAQAVTYSWTGAVDGDWTKAGNWDANGVPVDTNPGGNLDLNGSTDRIVFNAHGAIAPVPTSSIPTLGGNAFANTTQNTPELDVLNGTLSIPVAGWNNQGLIGHRSSPWTMTVGDGNTANGLAVLNYNMAVNQINRDPDMVKSWTVHADGTLNVGNPGTSLDFAYSTTRTCVFTVAGTVTFSKAIQLDGFAGNYFEFTAAGASVSAKFGASFPNLAAVQARIGPGLHFRSSTGTNPVAKDNGNGTFTVYMAPPPPLGGTVLLIQ